MAAVEGEVPLAEVVQDAKVDTTPENAQKQDDVPKSKDTAPAKDEVAPEQKEDSRQNGHTDSRHRREKIGRKTNYDTLPESSDPAEIRKQVEFYFSDANLASDRFLFQQLEGSKNVPVPVATIHSFKRMRRFQPQSAVVAALQESSKLTIVDADSETPAIKRNEPFAADSADLNQEALKMQWQDAAAARTVHAKGFGPEQPTMQFDIEAFFAPYGTTNQVRLRRHEDGTFAGDVRVEFDSEEAANDFLKASPKPSFQGRELKVLSHREFLRERNEKHRERQSGRGNRDSSNWNSRAKEDRKRDFHNKSRDGGRRDRRDQRRDHRDRSRDRNRSRNRNRSRDRSRDRSRSRSRDHSRDHNRDRKRERWDGEEKERPEDDKAVAEEKAETTDPKTTKGEDNEKKRPHEEDEENTKDQAQPSKRARSRSAEAGGGGGDEEIKEAAAPE